MGQPGPHWEEKRPTTLKHENVQVSIAETSVAVSVSLESGKEVTTVIRRNDGKVEISG